MYVATERLVLRDFRPHDVDAVHAFSSDPEVLALTRWLPASWDQTVEFVERAHQVGGPQFLAICLRGHEEPVGAIGAGPSEHTPLEPGAVELTCVLRRDVWRRGIATEAANVLLEELSVNPAITRIVAFCHPDNVAAQRLLMRLGMVLEMRRDIAPMPVAADVFGAQGIGYQDLEDLVEEVPLSAALRFGMSRAGLPIYP